MKQQFRPLFLALCIMAVPSLLHAQWSLTGNAGTSSSTNFIGTTDAVDFVIRTKNTKRITVTKAGLVGINNASAPIAQLQVDNSKNINTLYLTNSSPNSNQYGVRSTVNGVLAGSFRTAGEFTASGAGSTNTGLNVQASAANTNYGGNFNATDGATANIAVWGYTGGPSGSKNYAVYGSVAGFSAGNDYAGYFAGKTYSAGQVIVGESDAALYSTQVSIVTPSTFANGIKLVSANGNGNGIFSTYSGSPGDYYAIWGNAPASSLNLAAYFSGNVTVTGVFTSPSDEKLKQDLQTAPSLLDKVLQLNVKTYSFKKEYSFMNLPQTKQVGFTAQNMEGIFPDLVMNTLAKKPDGTSTTIKTVNYISVIPILTKALQEEHAQLVQTKDVIKKLSDENDALKQRLDAIEAKLSMATTTGSTPMMQDNTITAGLQQNAPNPFNQSAIIRYNVPATASNASLVIYSASGAQVKTFTNLSKGASQVTVAANSLPSGTYSYALIVDGKKLDSKQMVITR